VAAGGDAGERLPAAPLLVELPQPTARAARHPALRIAAAYFCVALMRNLLRVRSIRFTFSDLTTRLKRDRYLIHLRPTLPRGERPRFDWLREPKPDAVATPPLLMAFDLLYQDGREFTGRPLHERRARLEEAVPGSDFVLPVRRLAKNGFEAWSEVVARDYEGSFAKDEASLYPSFVLVGIA